MKNSKWLRHALLGGVALSVTAASAQADDLGALKAQIEALQARVNTLESQPTATAVPAGASLMTFQRGQGSLADWNVDRAAEGQMPSDRGFTVAITPTADIPAPVTEVTVSGYVKSDFIYDFDQDLGQTFDVSGIDDGAQGDNHFQAHARQTRFRIKSRTDTAIGEIRTLIEGDFWGSGQGSVGSFRLRHAWGEWDMTPNWTLGIGRFWAVGTDVFTGVATVDFGASIGGIYGRKEQVRLQYSDGPVTFALALQNPNRVSNDTPDLPALGAHLLYDVPGGHQLFLGGQVSQHDIDGVGSKVGWIASAGANVNLADVATLTGHIGYSEGLTGEIAAGGPSVFVANGEVEANKVLGGYVGLSADLTDSIQANVQWGFVDPQGGTSKDAGVEYTHMHSAHANIMWQPVRQMKLGWEVMWGRKTVGTRYLANYNNKKNHSALRGQFGAWFFF